MKASTALYITGQPVNNVKYEAVFKGKFDPASLDKLNDEFIVDYDDFGKLAIKLTLKPCPITGYEETVCYLEIERDNNSIQLGDTIKKEDIVVVALKKIGAEYRNSAPIFKLTDNQENAKIPVSIKDIPHWEVTKEQPFTDEELTCDGLQYSTRISPMGIAEIVITSETKGFVTYPIYGDLRDTFGEGEVLDITKYNVCLLTRKYFALPSQIVEFKKKNANKKGDCLTRMGVYLSLKNNTRTTTSNIIGKKKKNVGGNMYQLFENGLDEIFDATIVFSEQTGNLQVKLKFKRKAKDGCCYINLNRASQLALGDKVDLTKMKAYTYCRKDWDKMLDRFVLHKTVTLLEDYLEPEFPED